MQLNTASDVSRMHALPVVVPGGCGSRESNRHDVNSSTVSPAVFRYMKASDVSPARSTRSPITSCSPWLERLGAGSSEGPRVASVSVRAAVSAAAIGGGWWRERTCAAPKIVNARTETTAATSARRRGRRRGTGATEIEARISSRSPGGAISRDASTMPRPSRPSETSRQQSSHLRRWASKRLRSVDRISPLT